MATGPIHFDASYIRHLIDDLRAQAGMDESELLRRLTSELSWIAGGSILTEARLQDVILETARGFFTVSQIPSEGAADLYRFRLALLDRLAARMEVESEVLRRCQEGLAHLEFTLRPVTPAAATLAGGVKNAAQRFRAMQAPAEPPSPIGAMIAEELARPQREDVGSLTVLSLAWPSPPVIPFSTPHIWQFFFRPDSPPDEVSIELDRRLIDGMAAAEIVRQAQSLDWSQNFFPLWYALNRGLDAANQEMRTRFEVALRDLNHFFVRQQGKTPDKVYNWKKTRSHFAALSPEKVGNAFLSFRPDLENQVHALPPLAQGPQAPAHVSTQASLDPEVESRIRQEVERCGKIWGSVPGRTQNAADRAAELAKGLPGNSRGATTSLAATFVYEMLQILFDLGRDRVAGDQELSRFNRQLAESAAAIMDAVAWEPHIDEKSLQQIADASVAAKRNGRNLIATSTHESWVDITAIASLFQDRGVRFTYKSELLWVPLLNLILKGSNMALMDRVKPTGNPDKDGMARVRAIGQVDHVREMRMIDHALNVAFTPGTRSRVGGVGPAKKGDANQAIDNDSLILVMTLFGTGQIKPTSWSKLLAKGLGINRQVHLRTAVIDPRDFPAPAGITNPTLARAARVQAITDKIFETQVDQHLEIIAGLIAAASSPAEEPNAERIQLDEFLTPYADAFVYLERGEEEKFEKWCVKNKVAPAYVGALLESLPEEEVLALYERTGKKPTSEAMREHRVGPWAIANIKRRIKERLFTSRKPAPIERPQITYHDEPSARMTFGDYRTAYTEAHQDDAERVAELIRSQVSIQGSRFQEELAEIFLPELHKASAPYGEAVQRYIDAYESAEHPSYAPVSEATLALHREIMASPDLFPGLDPDLKIWALYTLEVGERFMLSELLGTPDPVLKARYYRLLGRGIRYRILNRVNEIIGGDPENRTFQDTARALWHRSEISELTDRAEMAELACELIASNRSLADELAEVKKALVEKEGELGWLGKWKPVSYRATVYNKLKERERLLEKLSGLGAGKSLDRLLGIAAGDFWLYRGVSWDAV
ncbi:MAG: 1-acyl-sn-glycerol-3-phosphate acyltransferase, partial [Deltaproteobacteria bacterium]|nr:1-acyl-sn-glycerol-3-phosphate acyltransferase [Deltaproteobacteria bacterium]